MANAATIQIARGVREALAGHALTEAQAKLYSQRLRRDMGQEGLATFLPGDVAIYLDDAILLLECGLLEREASPQSPWRDAIKRAGEVLEWLSHSSLKPAGVPLHLLAAAAYQLADYPAMALGHLRRIPDEEPFSVVLREFLRANFPSTLEAIREFWQQQRVSGLAERIDPADLAAHTFQHVVMCIGTVCVYLRTGSEQTTDRALTKLERLASSLLHSRDPYSYLLARLTAVSARRFVETCFWPHVDALRETSSAMAGEALTQFARSAFANRRALVWPAQAAGIQRLQNNSSFVLCTPTGSGKTTIATLGVIQGLFAEPPEAPIGLEDLQPGNLVLYLVPSRALAAEVEGRLAEDLSGVAAQPVVITGLYGGIDWGPTDAWIQADRPTIVICTFEKADALLRYLGVLFLDRVRVVIADEIHMVEQQGASSAGLADGSSRPFRLEQLGARLLRARDEYGFRMLALSAVAARAAPALARWVSGTPDALPTTSTHRSTRQMLGRLEVNAAGQFAIRYDLMDGRSLKFEDERRDETPFVPNPFPPIPGGMDTDLGPEVRVRAPTLWAALHLAAERPDGSAASVLISITQNIETFAATCADLMDAWQEVALPRYQAVDRDDDSWARCLASAADYFTVNSVEYRLLSYGIALHHGKMPGLLARRLKVAIDQGHVRVVIATSTLSEGVNIPVNFLLIPSVCRGPSRFTLQEFTNLIGRAGRPGVATEGSALVVLPERTYERRPGRRRLVPSRQWDRYESLVDEIEEATLAAGEEAPEDEASSPLAQLLLALEAAWTELTGGGGAEEFETWLEQTAVIGAADDDPKAYGLLDSLDAFLIAAIEEVEQLQQAALPPDRIEAELTAIWRRTYAFAAAQEEAHLAATWLARGRAIMTHYPDADQRRRIYKTSLTPRSATILLERADAVRARLQDGEAYSRWEPEERFAFIRDVLAMLSEVPQFRIGTRLGRQQNFQDWPRLLRWWLVKETLPRQPTPRQITDWYDFVAQNFIYRGAWGLGSTISLLFEDIEDEQPIRALELGDWPRSGLPWIAFWIKELINWGTLEPVAAFLLARGDALDRPQAEADALAYYEAQPADADPNNLLDPRIIRDWVDARREPPEPRPADHDLTIDVALVRPAGDYLQERLTVVPLADDNGLIWIDPAGYAVARSERPEDWPDAPPSFLFNLVVDDARVVGEAYRPHL